MPGTVISARDSKLSIKFKSQANEERKRVVGEIFVDTEKYAI